jgi:hypothetical protein
MQTGKKSTNSRDAKTEVDYWQRRKAGRNSDAALEQYIELVSVFKESSGNFLFNFVFKKTDKILCLTRRVRTVHGRQKTTSQKY